MPSAKDKLTTGIGKLVDSGRRSVARLMTPEPGGIAMTKTSASAGITEPEAVVAHLPEDEHSLSRRFVLVRLPRELTIHRTYQTEFVYLASGQEEDVTLEHVILPGNAEKFTLSVTSDSKINRQSISRQSYEQLLKFTEFKPLFRTVTEAEFKGRHVQVEEFESGLRIVSIHFPNEHFYDTFNAPDWLGDEVTGVLDYETYVLWRNAQTKGVAAMLSKHEG